jgi:S-DNA-T family DNA segregation ATPase FtsK/SpoIIIE
MSDLDIQSVLSSRYRTSHEADRYTDQLRINLGLSTKAQIARLAIGRSLALGELPDLQIDAKGLDIPATSLFTSDDIAAWVGMLVSHSRSSGNVIDTMEAFRTAVRLHWHRGAHALWTDWRACDENYDRFIETLVTRRTEMPELAKGGYRLPDEDASGETTETPADDTVVLTKALNELGIKVHVKDVTHGPRLSRYRVMLVKLADSGKLKRSMSQLGLALNLGNSLPSVSNGDEPKTVFIDLPRAKSTWKAVDIELLKAWASSGAREPNQLMIYAGVDVVGKDVTFDLATMPHLLVGGTTGSGKSVFLHTLILSLILRHKSDTLQLALLDPKQVEFAPYTKLSNLYRGEIAYETNEARQYLEEIVVEMETRYSIFKRIGVANIVEARRAGQAIPYIVVLIEELADLVLQDETIEPLIQRLAQKARAAGIHLVLATQRPDSATFSGLIRSNIPARIALTVQKGTESTIILDEKGAENLLGAGDMLIKRPGEQSIRVHGVFVRMDDVVQLVGRLP